MKTLTMQSVADLTQVRREVVSMWRTRSAGTEHPFPSPLSSQELVFEAGQVAAWLEATGRGNNPDAPLEVLLHSSQFDELLEDLEASSTLLLVHDLVGGPLSAFSVDEVLAATAALDLGVLVPPGSIAALLQRSELVRTIDELAEAAFSGRGLLDRLVSSFTRPHGPWAADALTPAGTAVLVEVVRGLLEHAPFRVEPSGSGGLLLATALAAELDDHAQPSLGIVGADEEDPVARAAMRMLAAHAGPEAVGAPDPGTPHLALVLRQRVEEPRAFFEQIESVLLDLGPADAAVVVGPSELLVEAIADEHVRAARQSLLLPTPEDPAPLRYAARLPKGLSRFGGRRRLAMWVFGTALPHAGTDWTVYGEHADTPLDSSARAAITADISAALVGGTALTAHAFLRSTRLATSALLRRPGFVLTPFSRTSRSGGESLARLWELDDGLVGEVLTVQATGKEGADPTVSWSDALAGLAREIRGARLPAEAIGAPAPGSVGVIGPDEVRAPERLGQRAIDRLLLETVASRSTLTAPGDVVFTAEGGAAAIVDTEGGHVLQAPARVLRCLPAVRRDRILHPPAVAADIARQDGRDRRTWRLRTVPDEAVPALEAAAQRVQERRADLHRQLSTLDQLEDELTQAVATGTLAATVTTPHEGELMATTTATAAPSTPKELKGTLWKAADKLRGSMDASQYKDVVLGLVFLKYVSDAFEERREAIRAELAGEDADFIEETLEEVDEYTGSGVFWVAPAARWEYIAAHAKGTQAGAGADRQTVGDLIDTAMGRLGEDNASLEGTLPRIYGRDNVDQRRLGELVDLLNSARFTGQGVSKARDLLGEVYEYFLDKFAKAEGKRGGEFYTPPVLVRTLVEILEPHQGRVYDPCCGSGGMFVQAEKFLAAHDEDPTNIAVYGQELNERTWRMAKMNLAIHGMDSKGLGARWGDTFARDIHPNLVADYVLANPPFNIKDWARNEDDSRWTYGVPPVRNANYAWMQHILSKLSAQGEAAVVMANGTMASNTGGEGEIRKNMLKAGVVSAVVAMPPNLFRSVAIPVCVWFFANDKTAGSKGSIDRSREVLFIDAREMGYMVDRVERTFSDQDIHTIANTFRTWRGRASAEGEYEDVPGFCKSATIDEIEQAGWAVTPGRFVGAPEAEEDDEPIDEKIERLTKELTAALDESARLDAVVREQLGRLA